MIKVIFCPSSRTKSAYYEALGSDLSAHVLEEEAMANTRPTKGDLILVAGKAAASKAIELFAWRLGGYPIYVPECTDWLNHRVRKALDNDEDLIMVDGALATTGKVDA